MLHAVLRRAIIPAISLLFLGQVHAQDEVRALWVVRTTLTSPSAIATMVAAAKNGGFNTAIIRAHHAGPQDWRTWLDTGLVDVICPVACVSQVGRATFTTSSQ